MNSAPAATASRARAAVVTVPMPIQGGPSDARPARSSRTKPEAPGTEKVISTSSIPDSAKSFAWRAASSRVEVRTTPMTGDLWRLRATSGRIWTVVVMWAGVYHRPARRLDSRDSYPDGHLFVSRVMIAPLTERILAPESESEWLCLTNR
jgi:hypothetical protein